MAQRMFTPDPEETIEKFTGKKFSEQQLRSPIGRRLYGAAMGMASTEFFLMDAAQRMRKLADKIEANVMAGSKDKVFALSSLGEVNGSAIGRTDLVIGQRQAVINSIQVLAIMLEEVVPDVNKE